MIKNFFKDTFIYFVPNVLHEQALQQIGMNIDFMIKELARAAMSETQDRKIDILLSTLESAMLAQGQTEYAFEVLDAAQAPANPVKQ